jgi:hypothetical protein
MPIPHFTGGTLLPAHKGLVTSQRLFEPVHKNLFEISFILPAILQAQGRVPYLMLENATSIDIGNLTPEISVSTQHFKYSTRVFMNTPEKTDTDFSIDFNVNIADAGDVFIYNTLRAWYDLVWDSQNGTLMYKRDIVGTIIVNHHDRKGYVIRRITYNNCMLSNIEGFTTLSFGESDILDKISAKFVSDYWTDEKIDTNSQVQLPNINA